jgi:hypothetical protein
MALPKFVHAVGQLLHVIGFESPDDRTAEVDGPIDDAGQPRHRGEVAAE